MNQKRRKYDAEFKRQAVKLTKESGKSVNEIAADLGVTSKMLYRWQVIEFMPPLHLFNRSVSLGS